MLKIRKYMDGNIEFLYMTFLVVLMFLFTYMDIMNIISVVLTTIFFFMLLLCRQNLLR